MTSSSTVFRVGTRSSRLALLQTAAAVRLLGERLPGVAFETCPATTPGDRDRETDLRASPSDFFTRDLDEALLGGRIDLAVHSAKDLPEPVRGGLDWCWLPGREDARDALVLPRGRTPGEIPAAPRVGVSSDRREAWCRARFPGARLLSVRGDIEARLAQLDAGRYDVLLMAAAALIRLGLADRIAEWIPVDDLRPPDGQGVLALTFRAGDRRLQRLRSLLVPPVVFAGAGAGRAGTCTVETVAALRRAEVCLHDALLDPAVLALLPPEAEVVDAGKRCGSGGEGQGAINDLLLRHARRGRRVVRLKGGDPGVFGRLAEEVDALDALALPYRVLPGVSSLQTATTGTGMLLTRRGESRGFCALTPRAEGGAMASVGRDARAALPQVYFMAVSAAGGVLRELLSEGLPAATAAAVVFDAGAPHERVLRGTVAGFAADPPAAGDGPGLLLVGPAAARRYGTHGALEGRRVLLTCSEALQEEAANATLDLGGVPVPLPIIRLEPVPAGLDPLRGPARFDWLVLTSPSAVHAFADLMRAAGLDLRILPKILVCGDGTARALRDHGLLPAAQPEADFGADGALATARRAVAAGAAVLRLRSDAAGTDLSQQLSAMGFAVTDAVIVRNVPVAHARIPLFDAALFASRSAVCALLDRPDAPDLTGRPVAAIGRPTADELRRRGATDVVVGSEATVSAALLALAGRCVSEALGKECSVFGVRCSGGDGV
jgi:uroporphyrinogen III methyltransferase/synthase